MDELIINFTPLLLGFCVAFFFGGFVVFHFLKHQDKQNKLTHEYNMHIEDNRTEVVKTSLSSLKNPTENEKIFRMLFTANNVALDDLQDQIEILRNRFDALTKVVGREE